MIAGAFFDVDEMMITVKSSGVCDSGCDRWVRHTHAPALNSV